MAQAGIPLSRGPGLLSDYQSVLLSFALNYKAYERSTENRTSNGAIVCVASAWRSLFARSSRFYGHLNLVARDFARRSEKRHAHCQSNVDVEQGEKKE